METSIISVKRWKAHIGKHWEKHETHRGGFPVVFRPACRTRVEETTETGYEVKESTQCMNIPNFASLNQLGTGRESMLLQVGSYDCAAEATSGPHNKSPMCRTHNILSILALDNRRFPTPYIARIYSRSVP